MSAAPNNPVRGRRRQPKQKLASPIWAYFSEEERDLVDRAAQIRRLSGSSFVAQAALEEAHVVLRDWNRKNPDR